jgi:hypothetical protein
MKTLIFGVVMVVTGMKGQELDLIRSLGENIVAYDISHAEEDEKLVLSAKVSIPLGISKKAVEILKTLGVM